MSLIDEFIEWSGGVATYDDIHDLFDGKTVAEIENELISVLCGPSCSLDVVFIIMQLAQDIHGFCNPK